MSSAIVGIVGTGLIGGSIGLRARERGHTVVGFDPQPEALEVALATGAIERPVSRGELLASADVIVLAAPLEATIGEIAALREAPATRARLILDVASVKAPVAEAARGLSHFVATHPMAGSERSGAAAGRAKLFEGKNWLYVPPGDARLESRVRTFIDEMGARAIAVEAAEHDRIVALTSHLPQLFAFAFARRLRAEGPAVEALCGPVATELLRLGNSNARLWAGIFKANGANVTSQWRALIAELESEREPG